MCTGSEQLLGEEGIAVRPNRDALEELRVGSRTKNGRKLCGELEPIEAVELETFRTTAPFLLSQEWQ